MASSTKLKHTALYSVYYASVCELHSTRQCVGSQMAQREVAEVDAVAAADAVAAVDVVSVVTTVAAVATPAGHTHRRI